VRAELLQLLYFMKWFACIRPGGVALVQGELACVQGELVVVKFCFGSRLVFFKCLVLCLSLAFDRLLEFLFICFFSFYFLSCYYLWVLSMHSRGILRTMCGSRTGGWSLLGVMSD
jgi:hypothetical protein